MLLPPMKRGAPIQHIEIQDLKRFMDNYSLIEMKPTGKTFTWSNGHVYSKIDQAVCNQEWVTKFNTICAEFLEPGISDHSPSF